MPDGSAVKGDNSSSRVPRGGSRGNGPQDLRLTVRYTNAPTFRLEIIGFRVARTLRPRQGQTAMTAVAS